VENGAAQQRDAADEGRLEASGSIIVGKGHREPGRGRAPLAADRECSADLGARRNRVMKSKSPRGGPASQAWRHRIVRKCARGTQSPPSRRSLTLPNSGHSPAVPFIPHDDHSFPKTTVHSPQRQTIESSTSLRRWRLSGRTQRPESRSVRWQKSRSRGQQYGKRTARKVRYPLG
jgi:hypothetical protein